jgi:cytidine deaminase
MESMKSIETDLGPTIVRELHQVARIAASHAYVPYSHFHVGAAVLDEEGRLYSGCNVENASFGLTMCAERNAIGAAATEGAHRLKAVAIYTPTQSLTPPCGACRQVMIEFGRHLEIHLFNSEGAHLVFPITQMLPAGFSFMAERTAGGK